MPTYPTCPHAGSMAPTPMAPSWSARTARMNVWWGRKPRSHPLAQGDSVVVIKDLKVRGSSIAPKQGSLIRNIRLVVDDAEHVEGSSDKIKGLVLKSCFLRKA
jgi:protein PhnA